ncbi:Thymidylate kinase [Blastocladiella emersonii ATCC 22665]|nr:Thymidylate kinase [Blastocladiella emersonii ATCC 22665]
MAANASTKLRRGALIVLEGGDRCGKTTQVARLAEALRSLALPVKELKFPDRTTAVGKVINDYLANGADVDDKTIHLLFSRNRWEAVENMRSLLDQGVTLVVDRYAYSGVAFSAAKGLDLEWCKRPDVGLPRPDLVLYLDIAPEAAAKRGGFGQERYETGSMQTRVRDLFLGKLVDPAYWHIVNADRTIDAVHGEILGLVKDVAITAAQAGTPLATLWPEVPKLEIDDAELLPSSSS